MRPAIIKSDHAHVFVRYEVCEWDGCKKQATHDVQEFGSSAIQLYCTRHTRISLRRIDRRQQGEREADR